MELLLLPVVSVSPTLCVAAVHSFSWLCDFTTMHPFQLAVAGEQNSPKLSALKRQPFIDVLWEHWGWDQRGGSSGLG